MKVFAFPKNIPVPDITVMLQQSQDEYYEQEAAAIAACKSFLIAHGYTGPNTGKEYTIPHADSAARYMVAEGSPGSRSFALVHLPFMDAWNSPHASRVTKKDVLTFVNRKQLFGSTR